MTDPFEATVERNKRMVELTGNDVFDRIDAMSDDELKRRYAELHWVGRNAMNEFVVENVLRLLAFEMSRRENDRSFKIMKRLTWVAIGVSAVQVILALK